MEGPLSPSLSCRLAGRRAEQVVWGLSGANPLSLGPGTGKNSQVQSPKAASLPELTQSQGQCGCSCFKSFFSSKEFNLQALSGETELSCGFGCVCMQAQGPVAGFKSWLCHLTPGLPFPVCKSKADISSYTFVSTKYSEETLSWVLYRAELLL